jgi:hypothetical protein
VGEIPDEAGHATSTGQGWVLIAIVLAAVSGGIMGVVAGVVFGGLFR